jgi:hypothetical protein
MKARWNHIQGYLFPRLREEVDPMTEALGRLVTTLDVIGLEAFVPEPPRGAPNVAARVQSLAEPVSIFVTATVQRQTAGLFLAEDRGAHALKGVSEPVTLYRIVRASGGGRRRGARVLTPLVGREEELALLTRRWLRALEGEGQFVQILGEPGIGKPRLIEEFRAKLAQTPHTWVEWAASQLLSEHAPAPDRRMGQTALWRRRRDRRRAPNVSTT